MKICLYGAGSNKLSDKYIEEGYKLGKTISHRGHELVFGGGSEGMMGAVSRGVRDNNGKIIGIAPEWMKNFEDIFHDCDEFIHTSSIDERKKLFLEYSDAFIISPGGIGTLDEFFDILTLKKLKRHDKAIILFNLNNYYDTLIDMIEFMIKENTIPKENKQLYTVTTTIEETIDYIENYK